MEQQTQPTARKESPELDAILGKPLPVLDDGFVRVVDYMGADSSIVQAARVSYGDGTKKVSEDRGLIRYLLRNMHTSPFEMCEIKFHVRVPMDCWRQWIRHRTANVNEYSTRYSLAIDHSQCTMPGEWRMQAANNKQGSEGFLPDAQGEIFTQEETDFQDKARDVYNKRIEAGIAREQARKDLPLSTYTEAYWKIDLHNLLHFLALRMDAHAQHEIRLFATTIGEQVVSKWVPLVWEAFEDYRLGSMHLSRLETALIALISAGKTEEASAKAAEFGWLNEKDGKLRRNRERSEFEEKCAELNITLPWKNG